ncbi:transcription factor CP2-like protein 1 [Elysia marginata]|uniref:Transcription factor CP2-like protein 1 n=1 Tax=Elysia marginata TaxID=1093978 RepID=A0AAV4IM03_9GAST|nr:transcription factor CP2-like protein 1 [Elysia marginata]
MVAHRNQLPILATCQSYEIKLKKLGDLSELQGKCLRSIVKVLFHDRRLQFMEKEQIDSWKMMRPGERILDIDIPLSYGLINVNLDPVRLNQLEFIWDPTKETGIYVRVHCISTEFTAKKHGGEKGVPFRIQVETYTDNEESKLLHAASCQIKVFKPKGADRKHKTDREKMERRSEAEKEKFQPSYECTVLTEVPKEQIIQATSTPQSKTQSLTSSFAELNCTTSPTRSISPSHQINSPQVTSVATNNPLPFNQGQKPEPVDSLSGALSSEAQASDVTQWLHYHRFSNYVRVFQNFSVYHAVYMDNLTLEEFKVKLSSLFGIHTQQIGDIYMQGPSQIHILLTDEVMQNTRDQARFVVEGMKDESGDKYRILLKSVVDH